MFLDIEPSLKKKLENLAIKVSNEINLAFGSIDIIKTRDNRLLIMEANSGVMMNSFIKQHENGYENLSKSNEITSYVRIKYNNSTKIYDVINGLAIVDNVILNSNGYRITVNFKNITLKRPPVIQNCSIANLINITHYGFTSSAVEFLVRNSNGTLLTSEEHNTNDCEFILFL